MIIYNSKLATWLNANGVTFWPFIFIEKSKEDCHQRTIKHEKIHLVQQLRWLIIPFYVVYLWDYCKFRLKGYTHKLAYRSIRFEVEAFRKASI